MEVIFIKNPDFVCSLFFQMRGKGLDENPRRRGEPLPPAITIVRRRASVAGILKGGYRLPC